MLTICIDESGNFEDKAYLKKFVGGVVYIGEDFEEEEQRLEEFFKKQCEMFSLSYPSGIHTTEMNRGTRDVKEKIVENLKIYLKENGKYNFTCLLKSRDKRKDYINFSNIISDDNASNLYEHMACNLIFNLLFYNVGHYKDNNVNLNVATRSVFVPVSDKEKIEEYMALNYSYKLQNNGQKYLFYLTDSRTFKAAIGTKMMEGKIKKPISFNMKVQSINYRDENNTMPYLYLADFACDIIRDSLDNNSPDFGVEKARKELASITGNELLCWAYDDIDTISSSLVSKYNEEDILGCLGEIYDMSESKSAFIEYYLKHWCKPIEGRLNDIFNKSKIDIYLSELNYLFSKDSPYYSKGLFMSLNLWSIIESYNEKQENERDKVQKKDLYKLADIIGRGYNHLGDCEGARKYFDICIEYRDEVDIEEYLSTINRAVEIDANEFNFSGAIEKMKPSLLGLEVWKDTKREVAEMMGLEKQRATCLVLRGKALSSIAQFYAFNKNKEEALKYFEEALAEFDNNKVQRTITLSYLLHLAIDSNDFGLYKKYDKEYFGTEDLQEQFKNIVTLNEISSPNDYKFYVYVKALNVFYGNSIDGKLLAKIQTADYKAQGFMVNAHPWQLIYKHLALLQYKNGNMTAGNNLIQKAQQAVSDGQLTIKLINLCTALEACEYTKDSKEQNRLVEEINKLSASNKTIYEKFRDALEEKDEKLRIKKVLSKFTFMYV